MYFYEMTHVLPDHIPCDPYDKPALDTSLYLSFLFMTEYISFHMVCISGWHGT